MKETIETLAQYYELTCRKLPAELRGGNGLRRHFNVFRRDNCMGVMPFRRRDYYKISLCVGQAVLYTEKGEIAVDYPAIFFSNPSIRFGWRNISKEQQGYVCLFNELYINASLRQELKHLNALFDEDVYPFLRLTTEQYEKLAGYFQMMRDEYCDATSFVYQEEMIQNILKMILYTAMKIKRATTSSFGTSAYPQIVKQFIDLLDGQFPVDSPQDPVQLITPGDFATALHVHVNHLNHLIKQYTGKPTSRLIMEKRLSEALSLLQSTDWTIAEVGASLGFGYPQHFNNFFKKQTGLSPKAYKVQHEMNI